MQCAELTTEKWLERRKLYRIAGIRDIWLFGANYYKEINNVEIGEEELLLRLKYLQQIVNEKERCVYFIDVKNSMVKQVGKFFGLSYWTETRAVVKIQETPIKEMKIFQIPSPCKYVIGNQSSLTKLHEYFSSRSKKAAEFWEERKQETNLRLLRIRQKQQKLKNFEKYKRYLNNFSIEKVLQRMSQREQVLFKRLVKEYYQYIHTPYPLWELLVFNKAIQHNYSKKQLIFSKHLFQDIKDQIRYDSRDSKEVATLIHSYLVLLEKCGFLYKKTLYRKYIHPFTIENNVLPIIDDKELNSSLAIYYSEFNLPKIGWCEYTGIEPIIKSVEQEKLRKAVLNYQDLVINQMESPLQIEEGLIEWFKEAALNQSIQLETNEEEFLDELRHLVHQISRAMYDTFYALVEEKFNYS